MALPTVGSITLCLVNSDYLPWTYLPYLDPTLYCVVVLIASIVDCIV